MTTDRLAKILAMLEQAPQDPFLLYGAGMEYKKAGDLLRAIEYFRKTLEADPAYCYAYYQHGQTWELAGDVARARQAYRDGIAAAEMAGDAHARGEIQAALDALQ
jgi:tetratricopeptide (TPR) repeat protein